MEETEYKDGIVGMLDPIHDLNILHYIYIVLSDIIKEEGIAV